MTPRGKRFLARINFERSIISAVNSSAVCKRVPLAGLSAGAIADWRRRAATELPRSIALEAGELLEDASRRAGLMADNSRIVIDPDFVSDPAGLEAVKRDVVTILSSKSEPKRPQAESP